MGFSRLASWALPILTRRPAQARPDGWGWWKGFFVGRVWDGDFTEQEYRLMLLAGNRHHLRTPDRLTKTGQPIYLLSDYERRAGLHLLDHRCKERFESPNVACTNGRSATLNYFANAGGLTGVQYFAVGNGAGGPSNADSTLFAETFRQALTTSAISGNQVDLITSFGGSFAIATYTECGLFGDGATGTANSGQIFNHASYPFVHVSGQVLSNNAYLYLT